MPRCAWATAFSSSGSHRAAAAFVRLASVARDNRLLLLLRLTGIAKLENLGGLAALRELRLDNNRIERIEGLDHLQNLTWLGTTPALRVGRAT